jgi:hypothetical protein
LNEAYPPANAGGTDKKMFSSHVTEHLSSYFHGELSDSESRRVAEHLIGCAACRAEYEEVKFGVKLAEQLPIVSAPETIWSGIEASFTQQRGTNVIDMPRRSFVKPAVAIAAGLVVLMLGGFLLSRVRRDAPRIASWEVARIDGAPRIGTTSIADKGRLAVGQWLETDGSSRAKIEVSNIGQVEIDANTRVRLVETRPDQHRMELARGRMSARVWAPPRLFFVNTPSAIAEDLGCAYTLEVDDAGNSLLRVTSGWVSLQLRDRESVVPAGAMCATRSGIGPGTPYFEDATEPFRLALQKIDFEPGTTDSSLEIILREARPRDLMTLWHLLSRVDGNNRGRIYDRMAQLSPPPRDVSREGIMRLDKEMLDRWYEKINSQWEGR